MQININVKVSGGRHTKTGVAAYYTSVNPRVIKFANGKTVSSDTITRWIESELLAALKKIEEATP